MNLVDRRVVYREVQASGQAVYRREGATGASIVVDRGHPVVSCVKGGVDLTLGGDLPGVVGHWGCGVGWLN